MFGLKAILTDGGIGLGGEIFVQQIAVAAGAGEAVWVPAFIQRRQWFYAAQRLHTLRAVQHIPGVAK